MHEHEWRNIAVGIGLIGIAAFFLWPKPNVPTVMVNDIMQPHGTTEPGLPAYLTANRPDYAIAPAKDAEYWPDMVGYTGLPLPDGLFKQPDGTITGGNFVGSNYVGSQISINNPGAIIVGPAINGSTRYPNAGGAGNSANPVATPNDCGCC